MENLQTVRCPNTMFEGMQCELTVNWNTSASRVSSIYVCLLYGYVRSWTIIISRGTHDDSVQGTDLNVHNGSTTATLSSNCWTVSLYSVCLRRASLTPYPLPSCPEWKQLKPSYIMVGHIWSSNRAYLPRPLSKVGLKADARVVGGAGQ